MANEFIGRRGGVALRKEDTAGTESSNDLFWLPKLSGGFAPETQKAQLGAGFSVIDDIAGHAVEQQIGKLTAEAVFGELTAGPLLLAAFGSVTLTKCITITGQSGGSPARGDAISSSAGSWAGTIRKIVIIASTTYYFVEETSGTIDAQTDVTNGTWTSGTSAVVTGVTGHYFSRLNTNNHPSYTLYKHDPISDKNALYGMLNSIDLEFAKGDYPKASFEFMAKKENADTALSPSYEAEGYFKSSNFGAKVADNEAALNAASLTVIEQMSISIAKNLELIPGSRDSEASRTDVNSIHNQAWGASGQVQLPYADDTWRDYVANNTAKAVRQEWINYEETALSGSIYPSLYIDWYKVNFTQFSNGNDNDAIDRQTIDIVPEYDRDNGIRSDALLINGRSTSY